MSYTFKIDPANTEAGMLNDYEEITTDKNSNLYKTKIDLTIRNPNKGSSFQVVSTESSVVSHHDGHHVIPIISVVDNKLNIDNTPSASKGLECVGVETRSCGKISDLINQFNNVEANSHQQHSDPKIPAKKLKIDFQSAIRDNTNGSGEKLEINSSSQDVGALENVRLPVIRLNFKMLTVESTQFHKAEHVENKITTNNTQFFVTPVIANKPLVKPRSLKNCETHGALPQREDNQPSEIHSIQPSETRHIMPSSHKDTPRRYINDYDNKSNVNMQEYELLKNYNQECVNLNTTKTVSIEEPQNLISSGGKVRTPNVEVIQKETSKVIHEEDKALIPITQTRKEDCDAKEKIDNAIDDKRPTKLSSMSTYLEISTQGVMENDGTMITNICIAPSLKSKYDIDTCNTVSNVTESKITTSDLVNAEIGSERDVSNIKNNLDKKEVSAVSAENSRLCGSGVAQVPTSDSRDGVCQRADYSNASDRINDKLHKLKSELMAMRKMDLVLLRQLINISQTIQRIQRSDVPRMSRSLTLLSPKKNLQRRSRPVERQNSAPHCADRRRFLFSNIRANTEDELRDSLSSFDESEFDSQSEVEESSSSLNSILTNSPRSAATRRKFFQSRDMLLSLDFAEDADENYEDILRRNVRLWKMGFQKHPSVQEEVDVWF